MQKVPNNSSEGVSAIRHPRSDFSQNISWAQEVVTGTTFHPSLFVHQIDYVDRYVSNRSLYQDGEVRPRGGGSGGAAVVAPQFDPATVVWSQDSGLPRAKKTHPDWLLDLQVRGSFGLLDARVTDPSYDQLLRSFRTGPHAKTSVRQSVDAFGWVFNIVPPYDPKIFPQMLDVRATAPARLQEQFYPFVYDLSWVHDVIPLTDPEVAAAPHLRPIAPIMSARRRNRRRR